MFTCKQVSKALSEEDYAKMKPHKRFMLKFHVGWCVFCGKFNRQVMDSQDMCRHFKEHEEEVIAKQPTLEDDKKDELKKLLSEQAKKTSATPTNE